MRALEAYPGLLPAVHPGRPTENGEIDATGSSTFGSLNPLLLLQSTFRINNKYAFNQLPVRLSHIALAPPNF